MKQRTLKPVAGYFRVSEARDGMSAPDLYRSEIERYCGYKQLQLAHVFSDVDDSGWRGARSRPGLEALKEQRGRLSAIIVPKLSRFGRSLSELVRLFDLLDSEGIALVFLDMNVDSSTSQGRLLRATSWPPSRSTRATSSPTTPAPTIVTP
jgi:DNA invertase Pin-like site-specific DNA recombinase